MIIWIIIVWLRVGFNYEYLGSAKGVRFLDKHCDYHFLDRKFWDIELVITGHLILMRAAGYS